MKCLSILPLHSYSLPLLTLACTGWLWWLLPSWEEPRSSYVVHQEVLAQNPGFQTLEHRKLHHAIHACTICRYACTLNVIFLYVVFKNWYSKQPHFLAVGSNIFQYTVKPTLKTTCIQRAPAYKDLILQVPTYTFLHKATLCKQVYLMATFHDTEPAYNDHLCLKTPILLLPRVVFIYEFHCNWICHQRQPVLTDFFMANRVWLSNTGSTVHTKSSTTE